MRITRSIALTVAALTLAIGPALPGSAQDLPPQRFATGAAPPSTFADPDRAQKLAAAFPQIDKIFDDWFARHPAPGAALGIIIDGQLVWTRTAGIADLATKTPVTPDTVFRIASMTKSFTAMSILKLRDQGRLSLDDPVAQYIPELAALAYPTVDSPPITIRHLLTHSAGFPEDNPWADRQLEQTDETLRAWMHAGIPFSTAPGTGFEYSNYGFGILGQVVARVSGKPYDDYVRENILVPLGMTSTTFHKEAIPPDRIALGYRWEDDQWKPEPVLAHGAFGSIGGLWTTTRDLAKFVAFLMSAFPPRDDADNGPIRRSSAREMQQSWRTIGSAVWRESVDGPLRFAAAGYGYGLSNSAGCLFAASVSHTGGLPGYGSRMTWLPEYGVGIIGMTNKTYTSPSMPMSDAILALKKTGALLPRVPQPSQALLAAQRDVSGLIASWDDAVATRIASDNLFLDTSAGKRSAELRDLLTKHGACLSVGTIEAENALRGKWRITCTKGWMEVSITLAPTMPPRVQSMDVTSVMPPSPEMQKLIDTVARLMAAWDQKSYDAIAAPGLDAATVRRVMAASAAWGACTPGATQSGDGTLETSVRFTCEKGALIVQLTADPVSHLLTSVSIAPAPDERCVP